MNTVMFSYFTLPFEDRTIVFYQAISLLNPAAFQGKGQCQPFLLWIFKTRRFKGLTQNPSECKLYISLFHYNPSFCIIPAMEFNQDSISHSQELNYSGGSLENNENIANFLLSVWLRNKNMSIVILEFWTSMNATNDKYFIITHQFLSWLHVSLLGPKFQCRECLFSGKLSVTNN